jgi:hypothetical protein
VAVKQVRISDVSGQQADEDHFAKLIVHEHPQYPGLRRSLGMSGWCSNARWCGAGTNFRDHAVVEHA